MYNTRYHVAGTMRHPEGVNHEKITRSPWYENEIPHKSAIIDEKRDVAFHYRRLVEATFRKAQ